MQVLNDNILVVPDKSEETTVGGIIVCGKQERHTGTVFATGEGKFYHGKFISTHVKEGDNIQFFPNVGQKVNVKGTEYLLLKPDDIICVFD